MECWREKPKQFVGKRMLLYENESRSVSNQAQAFAGKNPSKINLFYFSDQPGFKCISMIRALVLHCF